MRLASVQRDVAYTTHFHSKADFVKSASRPGSRGIRCLLLLNPKTFLRGHRTAPTTRTAGAGAPAQTLWRFASMCYCSRVFCYLFYSVFRNTSFRFVQQ